MCGGIAERFEVDATIVRVAFVVAACLWGVGVIVYLALWALVPTADGSDRTLTVGARRRAVRAALGLLRAADRGPLPRRS